MNVVVEISNYATFLIDRQSKKSKVVRLVYWQRCAEKTKWKTLIFTPIGGKKNLLFRFNQIIYQHGPWLWDQIASSHQWFQCTFLWSTFFCNVLAIDDTTWCIWQSSGTHFTYWQVKGSGSNQCKAAVARQSRLISFLLAITLQTTVCL